MTPVGDRPLRGLRVVVTRARPGCLGELLTDRGADVIHIPTITIAPPTDDGVALNTTAEAIAGGRVDWVVVTSATGADRLARVVDTHRLSGTRIAAVGPGTARALHDAGLPVDLMPEVATGEGLVAAFPEGDGRVVQVRPEVARPVVADGLRAKGWLVDEVVAYRTVPRPVDPRIVESVCRADAVTFTSPSTVTGLLDALSPDQLPPVIVTIGPVTSTALRDRGVTPTIQADPHTLDGLCAAVCATVADQPSRARR